MSKFKTKKPRKDLYAEISNKIADMLEKGVAPWECEWQTTSAGTMPIRVTGERYRGINVLLLWMAQMEKGYAANQWMTFKQAKDLGAAVRKGEKSETVVYVGKIMKEGEQIDPETGKPAMIGIPFLKSYSVFNVDQIDALPDQFAPEPIPGNDWDRDQSAEHFMASVGAEIRHGGNQAYYHRGTDHVQMPPREAFAAPAAYYVTLAHELAHWTGAPKRLDRKEGGTFGDKDYANEELIAELSACFTCAHLEIAREPREENAAYLANWAKRLREDHRVIFRVASAAQAATDFLIARVEQVAAKAAA